MTIRQGQAASKADRRRMEGGKDRLHLLPAPHPLGFPSSPGRTPPPGNTGAPGLLILHNVCKNEKKSKGKKSERARLRSGFWLYEKCQRYWAMAWASRGASELGDRGSRAPSHRVSQEAQSSPRAWAAATTAELRVLPADHRPWPAASRAPGQLSGSLTRRQRAPTRGGPASPAAAHLPSFCPQGLAWPPVPVNLVLRKPRPAGSETGPRVYLCPPTGRGAGPEGSGRGAQGRDSCAAGTATETWQPGKETVVCGGARGPDGPSPSWKQKGCNHLFTHSRQNPASCLAWKCSVDFTYL